MIMDTICVVFRFSCRRALTEDGYRWKFTPADAGTWIPF